MTLYLTGDPAADGLLERDPFALLIGMVLDQQVPLERAFGAPAALHERLGGRLDAHQLSAMAPEELAAAFSAKPALHRFPAAMAERVQRLAQVILQDYGGDAAAVYETAPSGEELLARARALPGFGQQKAQIFVAFCGKRLGVRPAGWEVAAGAFATPGSYASIADIDSPEAVAKVRAHKRALKTAARPEPAGTRARRRP